MNKKLKEANQKLAEKQAELDAVNQKVLKLEEQCKSTVDEKNNLAQEAKQTEQRLVRAEKLISGLSDEGKRWNETVSDLTEKVECMVGEFLSILLNEIRSAIRFSQQHQYRTMELSQSIFEMNW